MLRPADFAVAAAFVAFALTEEFVVRMPGGWWPFALALFAGLVLLRRVVPLVAIAANGVSALAVLHDEVRVSYRLWQLVAMIIAAYTAGRLLRWTGDRRERARAVPAAALVVATALIYWTNDRTDPMAAFFFSCAGPTLLRASCEAA